MTLERKMQTSRAGRWKDWIKNILIIGSNKNIDFILKKIRNCIRNQNFVQIKPSGYSGLIYRYINLKKIKVT